MATSPDYLRLAANATRALADTALDNLRDAVLVVDARHKQNPIVLANAAARNAFSVESEASLIIEAPLQRFLGADSAEVVHAIHALLLGTQTSMQRAVTWRFAQGDATVMTEIKPLTSGAGHRLVMFTFSATISAPSVAVSLDATPWDLLILNTELKVTYANATALHSGVAIPGGVIGCSALMLTPTSVLPPEVFAKGLQGKSYHNDAVAFSAPELPLRWFEVDVQPLRDSSGINGLVVLSTEVTERRRHNFVQGNSERRLLALTEHARDIMTIARADGTLQYVSGGVKNLLGYTSEERQSHFMFEHVHPDDREALRVQYEQLTAGHIGGFNHEFRIRHKDGSYRWLESSYVSALTNPLIGGVVINSRDVTERKQAEFKLAQREEVFRLAADAVDGVIFEWDVARGVVHRSQGVQEVLGVLPEDFESSIDAWQERVHPNDFAASRKALTLALIGGRGWTSTYRIRDARGRYRSMLERAVIQRNANGDPVRAIGCCVDVSEIKRLTDILAETQSIAKIGGWEFSYATGQLTWTDEMYRIYEADPAEFRVTREAVLACYVPESAWRLREAAAQAEALGGQMDLELELTTLKGRRIWVRVIGHVEILDGRPFRAFGSLQNIQAQKLAQIALENSTGWLKLSMNMADMHAWRWDRARDAFEIATIDGQDVHLPARYPGIKKLLARVHPQDQPALNRALERVLTEHAEAREEFRLETQPGRYRVFATIARPFFDGGKEPVGLVGVIRDVTARRDSEVRLRQSEELLRATTTNTADTLFLVDTDLRVRFINKGMADMTVESIIGKAVADLLPETARSLVLEKLHHILQTGETATYEFESLDQGSPQYFENRAVLVRDDGIGTGISISMRDITERKRLEQEILDVSGRERQSIGRDLHDGLGQELTGVALMLRGMASRIQKRCPDVVENVNEIVGLVNQSIETARALARGLLPVRTETGGLTFALRALAERSRDLYGLKVTFRADVSPELTLSETNASHLYRIAQEALTNAARHGRATRVEVLLLATPLTFSLRITDDGVGIDGAVAPATGMGLKIMRYRAGMIGAKFEIEPNEPHGTIVRITGERPASVPTGKVHTHAV